MLLIRPACGHQTGAPAHGGQVGPKPSRSNTRRQLSLESHRATEDASLASTPDGAPPTTLTVVATDQRGSSARALDDLLERGDGIVSAHSACDWCRQCFAGVLVGDGQDLDRPAVGRPVADEDRSPKPDPAG